MLRGVWLGLFVCCGGIVAMMLCEMTARFDNLFVSLSFVTDAVCSLCFYHFFRIVCTWSISLSPTHAWLASVVRIWHLSRRGWAVFRCLVTPAMEFPSANAHRSSSMRYEAH